MAMSSRLSFLFSNRLFLYNVHNLRAPSSLSSSSSSPTTATPRLKPPSSSSPSRSHSAASPCLSHINSADFISPIIVDFSRRRLLLSLSSLLMVCSPSFSSSLSMAVDHHHQGLSLSLERYTDPQEGFTLLRPTSWIKVEKAGATVLFEEANKGSNNVGIVVSPVRISSLSEFGTPQFVAEKLIQAERRKESTKVAEVISVSERSGKDGLQVYEFEYKVDSTRGGMKRVFSAAFVASKKLYLLNISHTDGLGTPLDMDRRMVLEQVLHSFDVASST